MESEVTSDPASCAGPLQQQNLCNQKLHQKQVRDLLRSSPCSVQLPLAR